MSSERVEKLMAEMTIEEKVSLLAGTDWWHTAAVDRLAVSPVKMSDGPAGVRGARWSGGPASMSFPCGSALGATWDVELVGRIGRALAGELRAKGGQLLLAPTVNLHRTPLAGRNFECYSEDPFLTARLAVAYITGLQAEGVGATVKHFVANDSEFERMTISSEVPERALRELYLVPFEAAVTEAKTWAIMSGYNRVDGTYCSENAALLTTILREEWGFDGLVVSDWFGTHSTAEAAVAGLDLEMPGPPLHRGAKLVDAVANGEVTESVIDARARKVLELAERSGVLDGTAADQRVERYDEDLERIALLREAAAKAIVVLRNEPLDSGDPLLPLSATGITRIAVIGATAAEASGQGGGSAQVQHPYAVSPLEGIRAAVGRNVEVGYERGAIITRGAGALDPTRLNTADGQRGLLVEYFDEGFGGTPGQRDVELRSAMRFDPQFTPAGVNGAWAVRVSGTYTATWAGEHTFSVRTTGRLRLWVGDGLSVDGWAAGEGRRTVGGSIDLHAGETVPIRLEWQAAGSDSGDLGYDFRVLQPVPVDLADRAVALAASADVAVVVVGLDSTWETEGRDRADLSLPGGQAELVRRVAAANPQTIVVLNTGAPVETDWVDAVPAVVQYWYPGQEGGNALADVLFGVVNPAGRLPTTVPKRLQDIPAMLNYPGERGRVHYGEGLFIGYRAFDRMAIEPRFAFGHGLSYTTFSYGPMRLSATAVSAGEGVRIEVPIINTGERDGDEVVQFYVRDVNATVIRPEKELKAFARVHVPAGETVSATVTLDDRSFAFWDSAAHDWTVEPGEFEILVGASSADIRVRATVVWT